MRTSIIATWLAAALAAAPYSYAQQGPADPGALTPSPEALAVTDADLETFATIYADLLETMSKFEAEMKSAGNEQQAQEVRSRVQSESIAKVAQRGWTPEKFNSVTEAINHSPGLASRVAKLIDEKT